MFEVNMDDYLDEEVETLKRSLESICRSWDRDVCVLLVVFLPTADQTVSFHQYAKNPASETARFLGSQNPDQVKRNLISSFTDVLLLPVTIVPMTAAAVGGVIMTGGTAAVQGLAMLNPTRWGGANGTDPDVPHGYETQFSENGQVHDLGDPEDDEEDLQIPSCTSILVST
jgi:recyclin-1